MEFVKHVEPSRPVHFGNNYTTRGVLLDLQPSSDLTVAVLSI